MPHWTLLDHPCQVPYLQLSGKTSISLLPSTTLTLLNLITRPHGRLRSAQISEIISMDDEDLQLKELGINPDVGSHNGFDKCGWSIWHPGSGHMILKNHRRESTIPDSCINEDKKIKTTIRSNLPCFHRGTRSLSLEESPSLYWSDRGSEGRINGQTTVHCPQKNLMLEL